MIYVYVIYPSRNIIIKFKVSPFLVADDLAAYICDHYKGAYICKSQFLFQSKGWFVHLFCYAGERMREDQRIAQFWHKVVPEIESLASGILTVQAYTLAH